MSIGCFIFTKILLFIAFIHYLVYFEFAEVCYALMYCNILGNRKGSKTRIFYKGIVGETVDK
jgi:hypothetical protein